MQNPRSVILRRLATITVISIVLLVSMVPVAPVNSGSGADEAALALDDEIDISAQSPSDSSVVASRAPPIEEKVLVVRATLLASPWDVDTNGLRSLYVDGVKSYYLEVSYNQVSMNTTYMNKNYTVSEAENYYAQDVNHVVELINETLYWAQSDVNALGGYQIFKHIIIVHSGTDQAATYNPEDIASEFVYNSGIELFKIGGVKIMNACVVSESDPLGVVVHELGHSQGLPDLYNAHGAPGAMDAFVGPWDLMATGSWNPNPQGTSPSHPTTWCKSKLGWIKPTEKININQSAIATGANVTVLLNPQEIANGTFVIKILLNDGTYYLVEDRLKTGYDSALPGNGVLVLFCNDSKGSGDGPVRVMSAHPPGLGADAAYNVGFFTQPFFGDQPRNIGVKVINKWSNGTFKIFVGNYSSALNAPVEYQDTTIPMILVIGGVAILVVLAIIIYVKKGRQKTKSSAYENVPVIRLS